MGLGGGVCYAQYAVTLQLVATFPKRKNLYQELGHLSHIGETSFDDGMDVSFLTVRWGEGCTIGEQQILYF